jgi:hypothetical protein
VGVSWTAPATVVTGDIITAAWGNTFVRDNPNYLKGLLDGTGADNVKVPAQLAFNNDAQWFADKDGTGPYLRFDTGDYIQYDRTNNRYDIYIGGTLVLRLDGSGKLVAGLAIWNSGRFAVAAGATVDTNHPWLTSSLRPAFVLGFYQAGTQIADINIQQVCGMGPASTEKVRITLVDGAKVRVVSGDSVSNTVVLYAILGPTA